MKVISLFFTYKDKKDKLVEKNLNYITTIKSSKTNQIGLGTFIVSCFTILPKLRLKSVIFGIYEQPLNLSQASLYFRSLY